MFNRQRTESDAKEMNEPLIDSDDEGRSGRKSVQSIGSAGDELKNRLSKASLANSVQSTEEYINGRIYANNAPRIFLEIITARTATIVIALTYIFFIVGFSVDFYTTYRSFNSSNLRLHAESCSQTNTHVTGGNRHWGCSSGNYWNSTISDLSNIISVKLNVQQDNVTQIIANITEDSIKIKYDLELWACYEQYGCDKDFQHNTHYTTDPDVWQRVLKQNNEHINLDLSSDLKSNSNGLGYEVNLIPSTFQNQESIPTNGLVKSYYISIFYSEDPYGLFNVDQPSDGQYTYYYFDIAERPRQVAANAMTVVLLFITLVVLAAYSWVLYREKQILTEQKWVLAYFVLLVLFQNPVYLVIVWYTSAPSIGSAYTSYLIGYMAQSGLFFLWLLFADSVNRKTTNRFLFYGPKAIMALTIFTIGIVILTFQFPGLDPRPGTSDRNAVEAVEDWSSNLRSEFVSFTILYLVLIWIWTLWWFVRLFLTGRKLKKLPYMSTRYIQLSYRFFSLQATLVTLYYVFQYGTVIYFISSGTNNTHLDSTNLADNINILFRQQTQLFGKTLFLTVYALILAFLFLPSSLMDRSGGLVAALAATYVITEEEHRHLVHMRRIMIKSMKRNLLNQVTLMNQLVGARADVFCIELAMKMRSLSFQAYYDPAGLSTVSGFDGQMDLGKIGFTMIDMIYNKEHEVFCFVARENTTGRLVVTFRGTASKRQMEDNLKYSQRSIDFHSLTTASLDQLDGLSIKPSSVEEDFEMESVSEEDEELGLSAQSDGGLEHNLSRTSSGGHGEEAPQHRMKEVGDGVKKVIQGTMDVGSAVVGKTAGLVATAASKTPGLKNMVKVFVHSGFWEAYEFVRIFVHAILRRELAKHPTTVIFTGHSLGGSLATFAAIDVSMHTIPRVNAYLKHLEKMHYVLHHEVDPEKQVRPSLLRTLTLSLQGHSSRASEPSTGGGSRSTASAKSGLRSSHSLPGGERNSSSHIQMDSPAGERARDGGASKPKFVKKIKVYMYNFGCPRVGNGNFALLYNKVVPNSYRIVVDGDIVPALPPPTNYTHIGTEILIDSVGAGSIIIDPSFVERWLRTHMKSSVSVHSLLVYRKGLLGIKLSAEFMHEHARQFSKDRSVDPLQLALRVRAHQQVDSVLDENAGVAADPAEMMALKAGAGAPAADDPAAHDDDDTSKSSVNSSVDLLAGKGMGVCVAHPSKSTDGAGGPKAAANPMHDSTVVNGLHGEGGSQEPRRARDPRSTDAAHLARDEKIMVDLLSQFKTFEPSGPLNWLKMQAKRRLAFSRKHDKKAEKITIEYRDKDLGSDAASPVSRRSGATIALQQPGPDDDVADLDTSVRTDSVFL